MTRDIWTIGHSTRELEPFVAMAKSFPIELVVDVRRFPHSRRHPHFNSDELKRALFRAGVEYEWMGTELGGFRKPLADSPHKGLKDSTFQGYADHMGTPTFRRALTRLMAAAEARRLAYMCSESNFKSCDRRMISDALALLHGFAVHHIVEAERAIPHEPFHEARVVDGELLYAPKPLGDFEGQADS